MKFFICSFYIPLCPAIKDTKRTRERQLITWFRFAELPGVYIPLRCAARLHEMGKKYITGLRDPFCPAEHHSCCRIKTLDLSEAKPSYQRPDNSEKRKAAQRARTAGYPFLDTSFG